VPIGSPDPASSRREVSLYELPRLAKALAGLLFRLASQTFHNRNV
jgi:hypothetical protein